MPIEIPCPGCARVLRVADENAGQQGKCPFCQMTFAIPEHTESAPPDRDASGGEASKEPPVESPYASPHAEQSYTPSPPGQTDIPGIISIVLGGGALIIGLAGCCCAFAVPVSMIMAIAGLITGFFGKDKLKVIGISLNAGALLLAVIAIIIFIVLFAVNATQSQ